MESLSNEDELTEEEVNVFNKAEHYHQLLSNSVSKIEIGVNFIQAVDSFANCKGKIITTGMGKAGIAMRKFSSTLCSLGIPSSYLHPGESSHGDLGLIQKQDILFVASTSGKTREVLETLDAAKILGVSQVIGITSHPDSPIRAKSDICLDMGDIEEVGELGIAPTSSILVMLTITDILALVSSEAKGFQASDYAIRHHGGYCGSKARGDDTIY